MVFHLLHVLVFSFFFLGSFQEAWTRYEDRGIKWSLADSRSARTEERSRSFDRYDFVPFLTPLIFSMLSVLLRQRKRRRTYAEMEGECKKCDSDESVMPVIKTAAFLYITPSLLLGGIPWKKGRL